MPFYRNHPQLIDFLPFTYGVVHAAVLYDDIIRRRLVLHQLQKRQNFPMFMKVQSQTHLFTNMTRKQGM